MRNYQLCTLKQQLTKKPRTLWKIESFLSFVHTELLAIAIALALAMQKWVENFAKEWVQYPFLAMPAKANSIGNAQYERTINLYLNSSTLPIRLFLSSNSSIPFNGVFP